MDLEDDLEKRIGFGIDPILNEEEEELRYDSDPEDCFSLENRQRDDPPVLLLSPIRPKPTSGSKSAVVLEEDAGKTVQDCLNSTWTLTWHRGRDANRTHAVCIKAWIERGTLVQSSNLMLEPNLMWREAYQGDLDKHKLNISSQKPFSVRLLNLCRILEAPANLDRSIYPLARISCSFLVRTSQEQEFLFEAASPQERDEVVSRWKICVARFALCDLGRPGRHGGHYARVFQSHGHLANARARVLLSKNAIACEAFQQQQQQTYRKKKYS